MSKRSVYKKVAREARENDIKLARANKKKVVEKVHRFVVTRSINRNTLRNKIEKNKAMCVAWGEQQIKRYGEAVHSVMVWLCSGMSPTNKPAAWMRSVYRRLLKVKEAN